MRNVPSPCILFPCEGKPISVTFLSSALPTPFPSVGGLWKDPRAALTQSFSLLVPTVCSSAEDVWSCGWRPYGMSSCKGFTLRQKLFVTG